MRIPSAFVGYASVTDHGFQTVVVAETPDHALDVASNSHVWEHLDFPVSDFHGGNLYLMFCGTYFTDS